MFEETYDRMGGNFPYPNEIVLCTMKSEQSSLPIKCFLFTGILHRGSRPHISPKEKGLLMQSFSFGGDKGSLNPHPVRWTG